jgi:hypothetical protein
MAEGRKRGNDYLQITDRVGNVSWRRLRSIQLVNHLHFSLEAAFVPLLMSSCFFCLCGRIKYCSSKKQKTEAELLGLWWLAVLRNLIKLWERNDKRRRGHGKVSQLRKMQCLVGEERREVTGTEESEKKGIIIRGLYRSGLMLLLSVGLDTYNRTHRPSQPLNSNPTYNNSLTNCFSGSI